MLNIMILLRLSMASMIPAQLCKGALLELPLDLGITGRQSIEVKSLLEGDPRQAHTSFVVDQSGFLFVTRPGPAGADGQVLNVNLRNGETTSMSASQDERIVGVSQRRLALRSKSSLIFIDRLNGERSEVPSDYLVERRPDLTKLLVFAKDGAFGIFPLSDGNSRRDIYGVTNFKGTIAFPVTETDGAHVQAFNASQDSHEFMILGEHGMTAWKFYPAEGAEGQLIRGHQVLKIPSNMRAIDASMSDDGDRLIVSVVPYVEENPWSAVRSSKSSKVPDQLVYRLSTNGPAQLVDLISGGRSLFAKGDEVRPISGNRYLEVKSHLIRIYNGASKNPFGRILQRWLPRAEVNWEMPSVAFSSSHESILAAHEIPGTRNIAIITNHAIRIWNPDSGDELFLQPVIGDGDVRPLPGKVEFVEIEATTHIIFEAETSQGKNIMMMALP